MQLAAFVFDYDGTLAKDGCVAATTFDALRRLRSAGPRLLLVTGRQLPDLQRAFPRYDLFDAIVVENGAVLAQPALHQERSLGPPPPAPLLEALRRRNVEPLSVGRSVIATWHPNETKVLEAIRECGLEWQIIFNKGAVMCLPPGVNKATGLKAALDVLEISALNAFGVGDAENDHAMLAACGYSAAVANAVDLVKAGVDIVTQADHGAGVVELIERFLADPPEGLTREVRRHDVLLGRDTSGAVVALPPRSAVLISGSSGGGKSRLATLLIERILEHGFQLCIVDPEGEYEHLQHLSPVGDPKNPPSLDEAAKLMRRPENNVVLNLLGVELDARPQYFSNVAALIEALRIRSARPHWLVADEASHVLPRDVQPALLAAPRYLPGTILVATAPRAVSRRVLEAMQVIITLGSSAADALEQFCNALGLPAPSLPQRTVASGEALFWNRAARQVQVVRLDAPQGKHQRHIRKYAQGTLGEDQSFYFRGERAALKLRAYNLTVFLQLAAGVDDETWLYHLQRGDYSRWFRKAIDDEELARETRAVEQTLASDPIASRRAIRDAVNRRYTAPAEAEPL